MTVHFKILSVLRVTVRRINIVTTGPTPIFKKRHTSGNISFAPNTNGTVSSLTVRETGTVYAVKISYIVDASDGNPQDTQNFEVYCHVKNPAGAAIVDLTDAAEVDGISGFLVENAGVMDAASVSGPGFHSFTQKFRFRRLVDEGDLLELIQRHRGVVRGTARNITYNFSLEWVIRTR